MVKILLQLEAVYRIYTVFSSKQVNNGKNITSVRGSL